MTDTNRSEIESLIDSMLASNSQASDNKELAETVTIEEGEAVICPDCNSENMVEGFVESDGEACLAYECEDCGTRLVSDESYNFDENDAPVNEAIIDPDDPCCPICQSEELNHQVVESADGEEDLILDCGNCGASMVVIPN